MDFTNADKKVEKILIVSCQKKNIQLSAKNLELKLKLIKKFLDN